MRRFPLFLATGATLLVASPAQAAFTASSITSPAAGSRFMSTDATDTFAAGGTSNNGSGQSVFLRCDPTDVLPGTLIGSTVSGAAGSWSANPAKSALGGCFARAIPTSNTPADVSQFPGRWYIFERQRPELTNATLTNVDDFVQQDGGGSGIRTIGVRGIGVGGGLTNTRITDDAAHRNSYDVLYYGGAFLKGDLTVDNRRAYPPVHAALINPSGTGLPALTVSRAREGATGTATVTETDPLVGCPGDPAAPDSTTCPSFTAAGVSWTRVTTSSADGRHYEQLDTLSSTDGAAHSAAVWMGYSALTNGGQTPAWGVSWAGGGARATRLDGDQLAGPGGGAPGTLLLDRNGAAAEGDFMWPRAAITWDVAPSTVYFKGDKDAYARFESLAIPAGGGITLRTRYAIGPSAADVAAQAAALRDAQRPPVTSITAPGDGVSVVSPALTVTGTASDTEGLASFTVNGAPVAVAADGTWSLPVTLALGANRFTAVATDKAGQTATAAITVTYKDTIAPSLLGLKLSRTKFRVSSKATAVAAAARKRRPKPTAQGTTISYRVAEPVTVSLAFSRVDRGRRSGSRCVRPTKKLRRAKACDLLVAAGTLTRRAAAAGTVKVAFSGRIATKKLRAARYRVTVTAKDAAGNVSRPQTATFTVVTR